MESLANKYRPQNFSSVVGQEHVVETIKNQLSNNQLAKAYCFVGGAGTGKTTIARILAREVNQSTKNILEIDGASNNGVDNIRSIIELAQYKPMDTAYKIIIIDEVHMLSTGAFNALLKTLEEPPPHIIFILATTDPQKIPATILSRVQRYDFKRMTVEQIGLNLAYISKEEGFEIEDDAIEYLAKVANGGMRNAISLLDTCTGYNSRLTVEDIMRILGTSFYDSYIELLKALIRKDRADIVQIINQAHIDGKDLKRFLLNFLEFLVDVTTIATTKRADFSTIPNIYFDDIRGIFAELGDNRTIILLGYYDKLSSLHFRVKQEANPRPLIIGGLLLC